VIAAAIRSRARAVELQDARARQPLVDGGAVRAAVAQEVADVERDRQVERADDGGDEREVVVDALDRQRARR